MTSSGLPREEPGPAEKLNKLPVPAVISSLQKQRDDLGWFLRGFVNAHWNFLITSSAFQFELVEN
jgi:hypothetical protein